MNIQKVIEVQSDTKWVLKVNNNIYGKRQTCRVWNKFLVEKLNNPEVGFRKSKIYECVLYRGKSMYIMYTADSIMEGTDKEKLRQILAEIKSSGLDITEEGYI